MFLWGLVWLLCCSCTHLWFWPINSLKKTKPLDQLQFQPKLCCSCILCCKLCIPHLSQNWRNPAKYNVIFYPYILKSPSTNKYIFQLPAATKSQVGMMKFVFGPVIGCLLWCFYSKCGWNKSRMLSTDRNLWIRNLFDNSCGGLSCH